MLTGAQIAEAFGRLLGARVVNVTPPPLWWVVEMDELAGWPSDGLRALWDCYDGCNSPLGFAGETIHAALNERGDGAYCAI